MLTFTAALEEALAEEMRLDPRVFCLGTVPPAALVQEFGAKRVLKTPISETAITGMAIGAAGCGLRPVVLWGNVTFSFVAFDQVVNQAAKIRQSPYSIFAHIAGLKVILPSGPADAKGLLKAAIRDNNPVLCFEGVRLADRQEDVPADHLVPLGSAAVKRAGSDVTVVAFGYMVQLALDAAVELERAGVSAEVVDPRSLVPLDRDTIRSSVRKTGRLVVVDEAPAMCSMASEIAAVVTEDDATFAALRAPIRRVNGAATPVPYSPPLEQAVLPSLTGVITAIREVVRVDAR